MFRKVIGLAGYLFLLLPAAVAADTAIEGAIIGVDVGYGNLQTNIPAGAMTISLGDPFTFSCNGASFEATWVSWYEDVAEGEWLGLSGQSDQVQIAVSFGHADEASGCNVGDAIELKLATTDATK